MTTDNKILDTYQKIGLFKNKLRNADFFTNPWQLGESFPAVANNAYTADGWKWVNTTSAIHTISKVAGEGDGRSAMRIETTTADTAAISELTLITQPIEGFLIIPLIDGGLFVIGRLRSDTTGIICFSFRNSANDRSFVHEEDILIADTFQDVAFFVDPLPTGGGTWDFETGIGLTFAIALDVGSDFETGTPDTWVTGNFVSTANNVNRSANIGDYIEFDRMQAEEGKVPTNYAHVDIEVDLERAERYYFEFEHFQGFFAAAASQFITITQPYPVAMRIQPVLAIVVSGTHTNAVVGINATGAIAMNNSELRQQVQAVAAGQSVISLQIISADARL